MSNKATISVIIPVRNGEKFIHEALDSVLSQSRAPDEIIVIDDVSTDATQEVLKKYRDHVRLIVNKVNAGPGFCRNRGVEQSSGQYLALLDYDDLWLPHHLETLGGLLDQWPEAVIAFCRMANFGAKDGIWPPESILAEWERPIDVLLPLMRVQFFMPSSSIFRRTLFNALGGFDEGQPFGADDPAFFCQAALMGPMVGTLKATCRYRWHGGQSFKRDWIPSAVKHIEHRVRLLASMAQDPRHVHQVADAKERTARQWEDYLEQAWASRRMDGFRKMVKFGLRHDCLRSATRAYVIKSCLPAGFINWVDRLKSSDQG